MTDVNRLYDIEQKLRCWGYLSHPDAEYDVAWLLEHLAERDARITELEVRLPLRCSPEVLGCPLNVGA